MPCVLIAVRDSYLKTAPDRPTPGGGSTLSGTTMTTIASNILVVGPAWVGDMIMAQSLFIKLKQTRPQCRIMVTAPDSTLPLLSRMPEVDDAIAAPFAHHHLHLTDRIRLGRQLRHRQFDQAIVLPGSIKSALVPFIAGIPRRTGYRKEPRYGLLNDLRTLNKEKQPRQVQHFVQLGLSVDAPLIENTPRPQLESRPESVPDLLANLAVPVADTPVLALCPGAEYGPSKRWPVRHFAELASLKLNEGWRVWLLGSSRDAPCVQAINDAVHGRCVDLSGRTSLDQAVDLLSTTTQVVSNDSGLMHIAAAVGRPLVAVYGSSNPNFTPPLGHNTRTVSLQPECWPCFQRACPLGHTRCLEDLLPEHVTDALAEIGPV